MKDYKKLIVSPHIVTLEYIFLTIVWALTPNKVFKMMGIQKTYDLVMFLYLLLCLIFWELGIIFSKSFILKEELIIKIRKLPVKIVSLISLMAGLLLIINAIRNGMVLFSLNAFSQIEILRASTMPGITTFTEFAYPGLIGYYYLYRYNKENFKFTDKLIILFNILLIFYRTMYMARSNLLTVILIIFVVYTVKHEKIITLRKIVILGLSLVLFYIFFESFRTYQVAYQAREYNPIEWGVLRFLQYLGSSYHYFINLSKLNFTPRYTQFIFAFIYDLLDLPKNWKALYSSDLYAPGLTVFTIFGEIYMSAKFFGVLYIFLIGFISNKLYISFIKNRFVGNLLYPLLYVGLCLTFYVNWLTGGVNIVQYTGAVIIILFSQHFKKK